MPTYLADYESELERLGLQSFTKAYPSSVLIVTAVGGFLAGNSTRSGTMTVVSTEEVQATALAGRVFLVAKGKNSRPGPVTIGRTADNDLVIPEYSISTRHCILALVDGEYRLTDLGGVNGTLVNEVRLAPLKPCVVRGGDTLRLGRFTLMFHLARGFGEFLRQRLEAEQQPAEGDKKRG